MSRRWLKRALHAALGGEPQLVWVVMMVRMRPLPVILAGGLALLGTPWRQPQMMKHLVPMVDVLPAQLDSFGPTMAMMTVLLAMNACDPAQQ